MFEILPWAIIISGIIVVVKFFAVFVVWNSMREIPFYLGYMVALAMLWVLFI